MIEAFHGQISLCFLMVFWSFIAKTQTFHNLPKIIEGFLEEGEFTAVPPHLDYLHSNYKI